MPSPEEGMPSTAWLQSCTVAKESYSEVDVMWTEAFEKQMNK